MGKEDEIDGQTGTQLLLRKLNFIVFQERESEKKHNSPWETVKGADAGKCVEQPWFNAVFYKKTETRVSF